MQATSHRSGGEGIELDYKLGQVSADPGQFAVVFVATSPQFSRQPRGNSVGDFADDKIQSDLELASDRAQVAIASEGRDYFPSKLLNFFSHADRFSPTKTDLNFVALV
jgi:hypothetical protein